MTGRMFGGLTVLGVALILSPAAAFAQAGARRRRFPECGIRRPSRRFMTGVPTIRAELRVARLVSELQ